MPSLEHRASRRDLPQNPILEDWFLAHPHERGETYLQHLFFTARVSVQLVIAGVYLLIHGLIPAFHTTTASETVTKIYEIFKTRHLG